MTTDEPTTETVDVQTAQMFDRLRELDYACGPDANKHDRATALIGGCIAEGINTKSAIIGVLKHLGFDRGHIAKWLDMHTGKNPVRHWWRRDESGVYTLHDDPELQPLT